MSPWTHVHKAVVKWAIPGILLCVMPKCPFFVNAYLRDPAYGGVK
ncbi:hypothetical protein [Aporhodopirellula aestuarii]|nr:hypothetical protein [Aporhodopirellula aestuarii]